MKVALWAPPRKREPDIQRLVRILNAEGEELRTLDPGPPGYICGMHHAKNCGQCDLTAEIRRPKTVQAMSRKEG